jgi:hypothetical protein
MGRYEDVPNENVFARRFDTSSTWKEHLESGDAVTSVWHACIETNVDSMHACVNLPIELSKSAPEWRRSA